MDEELTIRDLMARDFVGVSESDAIGEVAEVLLADGVSAVVVLRGSNSVGIVTDRRLLEALTVDERSLTDTVGEVMIEPGPTLSPELPIIDAIVSLSSADIDHLLVTEDGEVAGMVSAGDLVVTAASMLTGNSAETASMDPVTVGRSDAETVDSYTTQSVCEVCGSFVPNLQNINGQLVCADCRSV